MKKTALKKRETALDKLLKEAEALEAGVPARDLSPPKVWQFRRILSAKNPCASEKPACQNSHKGPLSSAYAIWAPLLVLGGICLAGYATTIKMANPGSWLFLLGFAIVLSTISEAFYIQKWHAILHHQRHQPALPPRQEKELIASYLTRQYQQMRKEFLGPGSELGKLRERLRLALETNRTLETEGREMRQLISEEGDGSVAQAERIARLDQLLASLTSAAERLQEAKSKFDADTGRLDAFLRAGEDEERRRLIASFNEFTFAQRVGVQVDSSLAAVEAVEQATENATEAVYNRLRELQEKTFPAIAEAAGKILPEARNATEFNRSLDELDAFIERMSKTLQPARSLS